MDGALDTARQFLAGRLDAAMGVASAVQARLVAAGLLSPSSDVRLALVLAGLAAFMLARLLLLRFLASLFFPVRVPRLRVPLTPLEQDLYPPGGTWVRLQAQTTTPAVWQHMMLCRRGNAQQLSATVGGCGRSNRSCGTTAFPPHVATRRRPTPRVLSSHAAAPDLAPRACAW